MENKFMFVGLPQSGKSSYIAALWHVVVSGELPESMTVTSLPEYREYLNTLRTCWLSCKKIERNKGEVFNDVFLNIRDNAKGKDAKLIFPDVAGEMFRSQFSTRKITVEYANRVKESDGLIVFISPGDITKPILISQANKLLQSFFPGSKDNKAGKENNSSSKASTEISKEWDYDDAPTQVVLIDLIQMILPFYKKKIKIGIVISMWDLIYNLPDPAYSRLTPEQWLIKELPMLNQFLKSNKKKFSHQVYGISAQGGSYDEDKDDKTKLYDMTNQSERIKVQVGNQISNDICMPIKWIIDGE
jgi:hypothetical protein